MTETKEDVTIEDLVNIWICLEKQTVQLQQIDEKSSEDIKRTFYKFLKTKVKLSI